jgi:hypothetical protein
MDGVKCKLRDKEFYVLPLTVGLLRKGGLDLMKKNDELVTSGDYLGALDAKVQLITMAIKQNHPDVTIDDMYDIIDLRNYLQAWSIVLGGTGLGEGEAPASTSPPETQTSPTTPGT